MKRYLLILLALSVCVLASGCVNVPYGLYEDERAMGTIMDDKTLATDIKTQLLSRNFSDGFSVAVYCYGGKVFLVGTAEERFRAEAEQIARDQQGVQSVTAHWFTGPSSITSDTQLELSVATSLITARRVSSTQVNLEVHGGQVVVLGMVNNQASVDRVLKAVRETKGVKDVVSYLLIRGTPEF